MKSWISYKSQMSWIRLYPLYTENIGGIGCVMQFGHEGNSDFRAVLPTAMQCMRVCQTDSYKGVKLCSYDWKNWFSHELHLVHCRLQWVFYWQQTLYLVWSWNYACILSNHYGIERCQLLVVCKEHHNTLNHYRDSTSSEGYQYYKRILPDYNVMTLCVSILLRVLCGPNCKVTAETSNRPLWRCNWAIVV